ncbi:hypothetical protein CAP35_15440 [Chitinophagaceae bacterium IBVUCB1]|nr:hypothetical protein CAP35_15440 [Chitinophagaceae bacterium IBVUCB1]
MKPISIITFLFTAILLMSVIKFVMVLAFRQNKYFGKKLVKSFFFYDGKKIVKAEELRLKKYYKSSNTVNLIFYSLVLSLLLISICVSTIKLFEKIAFFNV